MGEVDWERARLFPVSGIGGPDEQERRAASALLAVVQSVREFGRAITVPMGAPAGRLSAFIEVPFTDGDKHLRPDGLIQVAFGQRIWTALVEVKTGRHELVAGQIESYLDVTRKHRFDALLTISNQLVATPGVHPVQLPKPKTQAARLHHLSWSQIRTEALMEQANKSVSDPDQAWILAEFIRYLEHPRSGAIDFDDMGPSWVHVRDRARTATLHPQDKGITEVADRFGWLVSFAAMRLSRELGAGVRPMVTQAQLRDPAKYLQEAVTDLAATGQLHGAVRVPATVAPIKITADLRAGMIHCAVTVTAPREGRPTTRVNWLVRQLKNAPGHLCIEASTAWQRGRGPARTLDETRADPRVLIKDPDHELRAFTLSLTSNAGPARGQGHGSFVNSVLAAVETFYTDVVQHIKPWAPAPPKVRENEATAQDEPAPSNDIPAAAQDGRSEGVFHTAGNALQADTSGT
ncbi:MAG TPA: hypothetical protein VMV92_31400 [Streptosporangiaceae bacterium]|nr:hypothetical protein [Streptosporangiaceae bacterium]